MGPKLPIGENCSFAEQFLYAEIDLEDLILHVKCSFSELKHVFLKIWEKFLFEYHRGATQIYFPREIENFHTFSAKNEILMISLENKYQYSLNYYFPYKLRFPMHFLYPGKMENFLMFYRRWKII